MLITLIPFAILVIIIFNLHNRLRTLEARLKNDARPLAAAPKMAVEAGVAPITPLAPVDPQLISYLTEQLEEGTSLTAVKMALVQSGWQIEAVERAVAALPVVAPLTDDNVEVSKGSGNVFVQWLTEDWLMKLGGLLILIGFGWLTTYAFLHDWIGPMGRIVLGVVCGALFIALGWWRIRKYIHQGGIFMVVGSTTILLTLAAARWQYDMFDPVSVLAVMFLSTAFVAAASVVYRSRALALASLILAGVAPFLVRAEYSDTTQLFAYLMVVVLGTVWVVALSGMKDLTLAALVAVFLYSLPQFGNDADHHTLILFAYAFAAIFFVTNTVSLLKSKDTKIGADLVATACNGALLLMWIISAVPETWQSLNMAAWMLIFTIGAFALYQLSGRKEPFYVYAGVGIAMLAAATTVELNGKWAALTIAFTLECAAIVVVARALFGDATVARRLCWLFVAPALCSLTSLQSSAWQGGVIHKDFFVLFILSAVLLALGSYFVRTTAPDDKEGSTTIAALLIIGSLYAYILIWLSLHAAFRFGDNDDIAVMVALIIYTLVGITSYFYALGSKKHTLMIYGGCVLGFVVIRLLIVDVWRMDLTGKIITFFLIGALLISTAFLSKRKKPLETQLPSQNI